MPVPFGSQHGFCLLERRPAHQVQCRPGCRHKEFLQPPFREGSYRTALAVTEAAAYTKQSMAQVHAKGWMVFPYSSDTGSARFWTHRCWWCQHRTGDQFLRSLVVLEGQEGQVGPGFQRGKSIPHLEREELFSSSERTRESHMSGDLQSAKAPTPTSTSLQLMLWSDPVLSGQSQPCWAKSQPQSPQHLQTESACQQWEVQKCFTL